MAIVVVVGISIVIFRIQYIFSFIIENILGKTLTLSSRTIIWDKALALIGKETDYRLWSRNVGNCYTR